MNKLLENIAHKMIFTCEEATLLIEKKASDEPISFLDNIRLKAHLAICKWCNAYNKKVTLIDHAMHRISEKETEKLADSEMTEFKQHLKDRTFQ
jgi:hypothetical protein